MSFPYGLLDPKLTDEERGRLLEEHRRQMEFSWRLLYVAGGLAVVAVILFAILWVRNS